MTLDCRVSTTFNRPSSAGEQLGERGYSAEGDVDGARGEAMVPKLLRRLAGLSASTSGDNGTQAGKRPASERPGPIGEPLPSSWVRMHVWWREQGRGGLCGE